MDKSQNNRARTEREKSLEQENVLLKGELYRLYQERDSAWEVARSATADLESACKKEAQLKAMAKALEASEATLALVVSDIDKLNSLYTSQIKGLNLELSALSSQNAYLVSEIELCQEKKKALEVGLEILRSAHSALLSSYDSQKKTLALFVEKVKLQNLRMYSSKSERTKRDDRQMDFISALYVNDAEFEVDESLPTQAKVAKKTKEAPPKKKRSPRKRGGKRHLDLEGLEHVVIEHTLEDAHCPSCGKKMKSFSKTTTKKLHYEPAHFFVEEHVRYTYLCPSCSRKNQEGEPIAASILRAPLEPSPLGKSIATPSLLADIIHRKFERGQPLASVERDYAQQGALVSRQIMADWVIELSDRYFEPLAQRMLDILRAQEALMADETPVQVLKEPGRSPSSTSYMWVITSLEPHLPIVYYHYAPSRAKAVIADLLGDFKGYLQTDGYEAYHRLGDHITNVGCLAHARRRFKEVERIYGKEVGDGRVAREAISLMDAMFCLERKLRGESKEQRYEKRKIYLAPLLKGFQEWLSQASPKARVGSALFDAINYSTNQWEYILNVLEDGRLELSTNRIERHIRFFALGRRQWLFADTPQGATSSGAAYSLVRSASANGLCATRYVEWLLQEMPGANELTDSVLDSFMPWSPTIPNTLFMSEAERRVTERDAKELSEPYVSEKEINGSIKEVCLCALAAQKAKDAFWLSEKGISLVKSVYTALV